MDTNILGALATVAVAIGGCLTVFAYKHPREYRALGKCLLVFFTLLAVGGLGWIVGNSQTYLAVLKSGVVPSDKRDQLIAATDAVSVPGSWTYALAVVVFYLIFLGTFPIWITDVARRLRPTHSD
jgi:hypothetical protein